MSVLIQIISVTTYSVSVAIVVLSKKKNIFRKKYVTLNHNDSSISDPSVIAEIFNNYFSNIVSNLDCNIPHSNISPFNFLGTPVENSFLCPPPL